MAKMAIELKSAADRCRILGKENLAKASDLEKTLDAAKETRSNLRDAQEELSYLTL